MAKVVMPGSLTSNTHLFGGGDASKLQAGSAPIKRKTPSELRSEQLKRKCSMEVGDESVGHFVVTEKNTSGMVHGRKKLETLKNTKYVDTRLDEVYPARKPNMLRKHTGNVKDNYSREPHNISKSLSVRSNLADNSLHQASCSNDSVVTSAATAKDNTVKGQSSQATEKCSHNTFRNVAVLSKGNDNSCGQPTLDMNSVLKGLGARDVTTTSQSFSESSDQLNDLQFPNSRRYRSKFRISGQKTPIDLTLKSSMYLISSSSVNWCHRLITTQFMPQIVCSGNPSHCNTAGSTATAEVLFSKALHSWVFPQSSLPPSVISALNLTSSHGELDFLSKRQMAWEDSFRSLYYMLRKNMCNIFYVCTSQFVVMFTAGCIQGKTERSCNAFMSRSTTGLRSLLREHDISFSMPLCFSGVEHATMEDLVELSEIGKHNVGQVSLWASNHDFLCVFLMVSTHVWASGREEGLFSASAILSWRSYFLWFPPRFCLLTFT